MSKPKKKYPKEFLTLINSITNKRAKIVIDHILEHGFITTQDLEERYGYNHPPRAARDLRESGVPLETFSVKSTDNKSIAAYRFGDPSKIQLSKALGRQTFLKPFKKELFNANPGHCYICNGLFEERYLQVDHRIPYEIGGDVNQHDKKLKDYMLLCSSCNRAKSWSCENCKNWIKKKDTSSCLQCYWCVPLDYKHIAMREIRRLDIVWENAEIKYFERLKRLAIKHKILLPNFVKNIIKEKIQKR